MDFGQAQKQLLDLPATFRRQGNPFAQLIDAMSAAMARLTVPADGTVAQGNFSQAAYGWVDVWGLLFNIARGANTPDQTYKNQIQYAVNARGGPPLAITAWINTIFGIQVQLIEKNPNLGYTLIFPATLTTFQIRQILASIAYVRPAGVPFDVETSNIGTYLTTVNFISAPKITGAYLSGGITELPLGLGATTNNSPPSLPDLYLTDPALNPTPPT